METPQWHEQQQKTFSIQRRLIIGGTSFSVDLLQGEIYNVSWVGMAQEILNPRW